MAITPNSYFAVTGELDLFACVAQGTFATLNVISGGLNFFLPVTSLTIPFGATGQRITINPPAFPGSIVGYNNAGLIEFIISPSGYLIYDATGGALNHLFIAIQNIAGTDTFGNPFIKGIQIGPQTGPQVALSGGNPAALSFPLNDAGFPVAPLMNAVIVGSGVARFAQLATFTPKISVAGHLDFVASAFNSPNADGSSGANYLMDYVDTNGVNHIYTTLDQNGMGVSVCNQMTAADPSHANAAVSPAIAETWHDMRPLINSFVGTTAGRYPPQYRKLSDGTIQIAGNITFPGVGGPNFNSITFATLPPAYRPTNNVGQRWPVTLETNVTPIGTPNVAIDTSGNLQFHNCPTARLLATIANIEGEYPLDNTGMIAS